jgi:hypothetical protein
MADQNPGQTLLAGINQRFIDEVGPIGEVLIEDTLKLWRLNQWRGPTAYRRYLKCLAENIDNLVLRQRFIHDVERLLLVAQRNKIAS